MKSILILLVIGGAFSMPSEKNHRWTLIPDTEGKMHLYDLNPVEVVPEPTFDPINDVIFLLFTRRNPTVGQRITFDMATVTNSNWDSTQPTRFLIHGWQGDQTTGLNIFMTRELLARDDYNVVVVDWGAGAQTINYINARNRVAGAGGAVGRLIDLLDASNFITFDKVILVGHSLGSHVAGNAGKHVTRGRIEAIYATDPAGPLFTINSIDRLDIGDAVYTEALHTNAGNLGFEQPITRAAFYPNWGSSQPGCGLDITGACAHERSNLFYSESINNPRFIARRCSSHQNIASRNCPSTGSGVMGGDSPKFLAGVFFLDTNSNSPFARG